MVLLPLHAFAQQDVQPAAYTLGPGDMISVHALHVSEIPDKPVRIGDDGYVRLPLIGRMKAGGFTAEELGRQMEAALSELIQEPEVSVDLVEAKSHPVSILGAVKTPGVYQLQGPKRLLEMLSTAGGLEPDAGGTIRLSRPLSAGAIPLSMARSADGFSVAEIELAGLLEATHPEYNIELVPQDVVTIPRAKLIYVIGEVNRAGGFVLRDNERMSVLQALAMAEGLTPVAGKGNAKILRRGGDSAAQLEIPVDIGDILQGKAKDQTLQAGDVLFVPDSAARNATLRALEAAIQIGTGVAIWRR